MPDEIKRAEKEWEAKTLAPARAAHPERKEKFQTASDIALKPVYLPHETVGTYLESQGFPGQLPYTRGVQPTMYRGRLWTMRQYAGYADAAETNRRFRYLLEQGQSGLSVAFDLPTQIGYDADDPVAEGEVGKVGVSISCVEDMQILFDGIPLDKVSTSMTINAPAAILLAMYIAVAKSQGTEPAALRGTIQNDILKEYVARGTYIFPPTPAMRLITDVFSYCQRHVPRWNTISISGYHMREAGCTAVQEVAFTLANAIAYVEAALSAGMKVDEFAPQLAFFFNAHNDVLEEVAKFRAARRLWARLMQKRFGAKDPRSLRLRFHTQTAGSTLTAQQPENNVVRVALQALAAVLGGTQSLHTNSMDEALGLPTETAARLALRTQQVIAHETGVADTVDPLAGSYLIENLTDEIERRSMEYIECIDELGGALAAVEAGFMQTEIQEAAYQAQMRIESHEDLVVGVNAYRSHEVSNLETLSVAPDIEAAQREHLGRVRSRRDRGRADELLARLGEMCRGSENLMPILIECVEADLTLGEICGEMRTIWGEYRPAVGL
ncbi:MAG: methylmalonyl-CoA mutase family protein [Anaerolineae bacterium]|nr:MAG: methylmalonyl-CoA mutase family protein [Anaerolineae bacterium]